MRCLAVLNLLLFAVMVERRITSFRVTMRMAPAAAASASSRAALQWRRMQMAVTDYAPPTTAARGSVGTDVVVEAPAWNARRITASIVINSPVDDVWSVLTAYDRLAERIPNLVQSYVVPGSSSRANPVNARIFQEGAQKIVGFDFRAALTMDMRDGSPRPAAAAAAADGKSNDRRLYFTLAESRMFSGFDGSWRARALRPSGAGGRPRTLLTYDVLVKPKGPVPVFALEWRIKEDVPTNLLAMKVAAEKWTTSNAAAAAAAARARAAQAATAQAAAAAARPAAAVGAVSGSGGDRRPRPQYPYQAVGTKWESDETLGMYIIDNAPTAACKRIVRRGSTAVASGLVRGRQAAGNLLQLLRPPFLR
jgi:hypothetical protein